jgi:hypothetical protein
VVALTAVAGLAGLAGGQVWAHAYVPAAIGIAIIKYRLYDIGTIINRTLVYGLLTLMLALVYFGACR